MPPKPAGGKSKQIQSAKAAAKSQSAKGSRKKWSKGKSREKLNNMILFDKDTYAKLLKDIPTAKVITTATISDRMKCNGSLARRAIKELLSKGLIRQVIRSHGNGVYTSAVSK
ncbi:40S ribosomal protein S25 [Tieghemostelium lacteum]|uniref:40S ribosomal protein S25 n=1 Tax=Tieghemostelium lacteum TaxID=361077 RepID=A0A151ZES0_TIELA|nr:40S ribosomal protein S25 [Tieghemostelium lacteum]|eukprot:KYQ92458.1 40S ribosomal protein S25 [Tieghemostelium lacteum]